MKTNIKLIALVVATIIFMVSCNRKQVITCFDYYSNNFDTITPIFFNAQCSQGADSYRWYFGDGSVEFTDADTISYRYTTPGTYTIKLRSEKSEKLDGGAPAGSIMEMEKTITIN